VSIKVPVTVELKDEAQLGKILEMVEGDAPPANKVDAFVNEVIGQVIAGAMILSSGAVDRLLDISPELDSEENIIEAVGAGSGVDGGEMVIRWPTDPALTQPLRDRALTQGVSVQHLISDTMSQFVALGYFYDIAVDMKIVFLNREDEAEAAKILGNKDFTSADIMDRLRKSAAVQPDDEDDEEDDNPDDGIFDTANTQQTTSVS
jgi:hypothetical protein